MIEVLATANAWRGTKTVVARKTLVKGYPAQDDSVAQISQIKVKNDLFSAPLFEIEEKFEMGYLAELFLGTAGSTFFYAVLCLYLYGVSTIRLFIILQVTREKLMTILISKFLFTHARHCEASIHLDSQ